MARTATYDSKQLSSKTARLKLKPRGKAYFTTIEPCLTLGYIRRASGAGTWVVRRQIGRTDSGWPKWKARSIAPADDFAPADDKNILSYEQAFRAAAGGALTSSASALTVKVAVDRYIEHVKAHNSERASYDAGSKLNKHVVPDLGDLRVRDLTLTRLQAWQAGLIRRDDDDPDAERRSKDTANRVIASFKAALNHAFNDEKNGIATDTAWRRLKAFKDVSARREDHFTEAEALTLIEAAREDDPSFAHMLEAAFHTGARYGELCILDVRHFDAKQRQIIIPGGKTGDRITTLTAEGAAFFKRMAEGKKPRDVLLPHANGERWDRDQQTKPMQRALAAANLPESASFYTMRHTVISRAIERGMPLTLIAENVGTSVRMIEQNYGKFIAQTRRELIERTAPSLRVIAKIGGEKVAA